MVAGPEVAIGLYSEDEFKGEKTIIQPNHESAVGTKKEKVHTVKSDLVSLLLSTHHNALTIVLQVMSFILLSTKYDEHSAAPELFVKAEKFANMQWTSSDFPSRKSMKLRH